MSIVDDGDVEKALDFLRNSALDIAQARENAVRAGHMVKHVRAIECKRHNELSAAKAEVEALASPAYLAAISHDAEAAGEFEKLKSLREAADAKIRVWQSANANYRAMKI